MAKLIYQARTSRKPFVRRLIFVLIGIIVVGGTYFTLELLTERRGELERGGAINPDVLDIGKIAAGVALGLLIIRAVWLLLRLIRSRNEGVRVFDRGFMWYRRGDKYQYSWKQVQTYQQGARQRRILGLPLGKTGSQTLTMYDGRVFNFTHRLGDPALFDRAISSILATITASRIGQALREDRNVKVGKDLMMAPAGLVAGKHRIRWKDLDLELKNDRLIIRRLTPDGQFQPVTTYGTHQIVNLYGFLDIAQSVIQNHQPHRFNIQTRI